MARRGFKAPKFGAFYIFIAVLLIFLVLSAVFYGGSKSYEEPAKESTIEKIDNYLKRQKESSTGSMLEPKTQDSQSAEQNNPEQKIEQNELNSDKFEPQLMPPLKPSLEKEMPKLAIIIDDIATFAHAKSIKELGLNITPSILPPTKERPNSAKVAFEFDFYMVHLPLEANSYKSEESGTIKVGDGAQKIEQTIAKIKQDFSGVRFINNHTGSKFTSDYASMKLLFSALKKHDINFIDSRTDAESKAKQVSAEMGSKFVKRDVFIDNQRDINSILKALAMAVKKAKDSGKAIAIGHPYSETFKALKEAKKEIFKGVEIILIRDIYELYN